MSSLWDLVRGQGKNNDQKNEQLLKKMEELKEKLTQAGTQSDQNHDAARAQLQELLTVVHLMETQMEAVITVLARIESQVSPPPPTIEVTLGPPRDKET